MLVTFQQQLKQKYNTLYHRVVKAQQTGRFALYNATQKRALYQRLRRYENRLKNWGIAVASAAALFAVPTVTKGQITFTEQIGLNNPFEVLAPNNPFNGVDVGYNSAPTFVDIDGDGDFDAFSGESLGTIKYYQNTGSSSSPSFVEQMGNSNPFDGVNVGYGYSTPAFVDIDGDGDFDAFIGEKYGIIKYYKNTGSSSSPSFVEQTGSSNPFDGVDVGFFGSSAPTFVDIDGDGDMDAFIGDIYGNINYYENTGSSSSPNFLESQGSNPFMSIIMIIGANIKPTFVDIDGDGDFDAFIGERVGTINYFQNTGSSSSPSFLEQTGNSNPLNVNVGDRYSAPTFVDIDGDGDFDAFSGERLGFINYFQNTGSSNSPSFSLKQGVIDVGNNSAPTFVDIDGDGDFDAFSGEYDSFINYYQNAGSRSIPSFWEQTGSTNPFNGVDVVYYSTPSFVDIDGDGDFDAFVGERYGNINYYQNTGSNSSPSFLVQTGNSNPFNSLNVGNFIAPTFVDIDGDGDFDAFIGESDGNINYYQNTGSRSIPSFWEQTGSANPFNGVDVGYYSTPSFVDIDGDGDFDAFIGERYGNINYYQNTGSRSIPSFLEQTGSSNPLDGVDVGYNSTPTFVDIDGDGDFDAFIGERDGNINYFQNTPMCIAEAGELGNSQDIATIALCEGADSGVVFEQTGASAGEEYAFLLVDGNGDIVANTTDGDFDLATLSVGSFTVYGLSYANINSPSTVADYLADKTSITAIETDDAGTTFCLDLSNTATTGETNIITVKPNPVISQQPSDAMICAGESATFEVTASGNNLSYQWQLDNTNLSNENNATLSTSQAGDYNVLITENGCTISSDTVSLTLDPSCDIPDISTLEVSYCGKELSADFEPVPGAVGYRAEVTILGRNGEVIIINIPRPPFDLKISIPKRLQGTTFRVRLVAIFIDDETQDELVGTFSESIDLIIGCENSGINDGIESRGSVESTFIEAILLPNPTSESLTLSYESPSASQADIAIVDGTGKLVWQSKQASSEGDNQVTIAVADLPAGMYQLRLVIAEEVVVMPFVKQ